MTEHVLIVLHKMGRSFGYYDVRTGERLACVQTLPFPHEACLSPDRAKLYVTEYGLRGLDSPGIGGNTIGVFDVLTRQRVSTISTGRYDRPHGIASSGEDRLLVTSESTKSLLIFDLTTQEVLHAVYTGKEIGHMVRTAPDGKTAYVINLGSNDITGIDIASGTVLRHIPVLEWPEDLAFSPDGRTMYVVHRHGKAVAVVDVAKWEMVDRFETGNGPVRVVITPDGKRLAFPLFLADAVQIADTESRTVTHTISVGRQPAGIAMSGDGDLIFVACELANTVYVLAADSMTIVNEIKTENGCDAMICLDAAELQR